MNAWDFCFWPFFINTLSCIVVVLKCSFLPFSFGRYIIYRHCFLVFWIRKVVTFLLPVSYSLHCLWNVFLIRFQGTNNEDVLLYAPFGYCNIAMLELLNGAWRRTSWRSIGLMECFILEEFHTVNFWWLVILCIHHSQWRNSHFHQWLLVCQCIAVSGAYMEPLHGISFYREVHILQVLEDCTV